MLKSVYSRIFYFCTIVLMFACALTGLTVELCANKMHEREAYSSFDATARILITKLREINVKGETNALITMQTELETYTINENVDCYLFDSDGNCLLRSDYSDSPIVLSAALRSEAAKSPYCQMGGASGNFTEPTATYVEYFDMGGRMYYLMLLFPISYVSDFSVRLLTVLVISVLVIGVFGAGLFYLNTAKLLKPLSKITRTAEDYAKGDFSPRLAPTGEPELDRLTETMNRMADFIDSNERSRKRFVSDVSHELKTPMTTIGGYVDAILDGAVPKEEERHYLETVSSEVRRMSRMVNSMLNISKFEEGSLSPNYTRFDISHLLIRTLLLFERKAEEKHLSVAGLEECPRTYVIADKDLMQQVFYNLTENAIKFADEGGTLTLAVDADTEQAHVRIRNSGEGLSESEISHVFERFYKTDSSRGKDTPGVGLGLSIVSRIMVLHGGSVTVKSVQGEYTEFIVSLPLEQPAAEETAQKQD